MLVSQTLDALGDDPTMILDELAALLHEDAGALAGQLLHWPEGKGQALKRVNRLKELRQSPHLDERLAVALYERWKKKPR